MIEKGFQKVWLYQLLCLATIFCFSLINMFAYQDSSIGVQMFSELCIIIPCILGYKVIRNKCGVGNLKDDLGFRGIKPEYIPYVIFMPILYQLFCIFMTMPLNLGLDVLFGSDTPQIDMPESVFEYIATILGLCVFAPVLEEFIYRGVMVRFMKGYSFQAVMLTTSLAFSMMHMNMSGFVQIFFIGMFLFVLRTATGSLLSSIAAHSIINLMSFLLMLLTNSDGAEKFAAILSTVEIGSLIVMPILMVNFFRITCENGKWTAKYRLKGEKPGFSLSLTVFVIIYIIWNLGILANNIDSGYTKRAVQKYFCDGIISEEDIN